MINAGLILEGGAMRGLFTAGVCDVLMENNIDFPCAMGVSAGALFGCNLKSKQIGRVVRYNTTYCNDSRYSSLISLLKTGDLYNYEFCYKTLVDELDIFDRETYNKNPMQFFAVATNAITGEPEYHDCKIANTETLDWFRASGAMPLAARPVKIGNKILVDGGISDSIPLKKMQDMGFAKNVVILTQPADYIKKENKLLPLLKINLRKYPKVIEAIKDRHIRYNNTLDFIRQEEANGNAFVIRPPAKLKVGMRETDPERLRAIYEIGRETTISILPQLKAWLKLHIS